MPVYLLAAACAIGVVLIAARLVKRGTEDAAPDGPTTGHTGAMISALFLLAFAVAIVVPWTSADSARLNTYAEGQAVVEAAWTAERLPTPLRAPLQDGLSDYARFVRDSEWRMMADGKLSPDGWTRLERLRRAALALPAGEDEEKDARSAMLDQIAQISTARHQRAMDAKTTPPAGLLVITLLTGLLVILLPFLSGARPRGMALVPLALMAGLLGVGVYLCLDIMHVFTGALAVEPDAFTSVLAEMRRISSGG
ncbi:bestrophin-like domain [Actinomadura hibisca]|uniref:bestrophin-like domain n=1 Tax=Actinomadura hibisca TaxID=68565 RepID=UPI000837078B|nr:DUF4239 domain-containing protein [Actinomadura hibisca]